MIRFMPDGENGSSNSITFPHRQRLKEDLPPFFWLQYWASLFAAWGIVPATILGLWGRYLYRQHAAGSLSLALVLVVCTGLGLGFYQMARSTLQGGLLKIPTPGALDLRETLWEFAGWAGFTFFGLLVFYASYEAAGGSVFGSSVVRQSDCTLCKAARPRLTFSRISEAVAVQMKGVGCSLCWAT